MDKILNIIRQSFVSFSGEILIKILGFFFKLYLVHNLLEASLSLGIFALGIAIIDFFSPFTSLGLGAVATRYIPKWEVKKQEKHKNDFVSTASTLVFFLSILLSLIIFIFKEKVILIFPLINNNNNNLVVQTEFLYLLPIFLILMVFKHQSSILNQFLIGFKELKKTVIYSNFIGFPVKFFLLIILIGLGLDFKGLLYSEILTLFFILISFILVLKNILGENFSFSINFKWAEKKLFIYALTFLLLGFLTKVTGFLDKFLLLKHMSINDVGVYYMTFTFVNFLPLVLKSINTILAPIISELWEQDNIIEIQNLYYFFTKWTVILSFPIIFFVIFFNKELMMLFGTEFLSGNKVLIILAIAHSISIMFGSVRTILQMTDKHINIFSIELLRTVLVVAIMLILVPKLHMEGAAIALGVGIIFNNIINYFLLYNHLKIIPYKKSFWKIVIVIILTTMVLILLLGIFNKIVILSYWYWMVLSFVFIFITTLVLSRVICFSKHDKEVFSRIFKK